MRLFKIPGKHSWWIDELTGKQMPGDGKREKKYVTIRQIKTKTN